MKYQVEIDITIGDEVITTYLPVEADSQEEAYEKAKEIVKNSLEARIEKNPIEEL